MASKREPATTWTHPKLGKFEYSGTDWERIVSVQAFKAFSWDTGFPNAPRSKGKHELAFQTDSGTDLPSRTAIALAERVLANQAVLVAKIRDALWDDFNGRGPDSGMWWRGHPEIVARNMDADEPPRSADDLMKLMQLSSIRVCENVHGDGRLVVELSFHAAFEGEHGVGVLTDGRRILGIGYMSDVTPFKPAKRRRSGSSR